MLRLAIVGASGRLGQRVLALALGDEDIEVVAALTRPGSDWLGHDAGEVCGLPRQGLVLRALGPDALGDADVVVDASLPAGTRALLPLLGDRALVTGVTGLAAEDARALDDRSRRAPVLRADNFSVGVQVLRDLAARAAAALPDADVEIVETHHRHKRDAPSGTAAWIARTVAAARAPDPSTVDTRHGRQGVVGARPAGEIGVHALRGGDVVGEHVVHLLLDGERLTVGHAATSRDVFARGALRAATWIAGRPPGAYDLRDVLGLGPVQTAGQG